MSRQNACAHPVDNFVNLRKVQNIVEDAHNMDDAPTPVGDNSLHQLARHASTVCDLQTNRAACVARRGARPERGYWNSATADLSVIQTPHASGMPTKAQNAAAFASRPPLPIPNEPCGIATSFLARAACNLATSSELICTTSD